MSSSVNIPMLTLRGEPGIFDFVSLGNFDRPVQSEVRIERAYTMATCWYELCHAALKGAWQCRN